MTRRREFLAATAGALGITALGVPRVRAAVGEDWNKVVAEAKGQDLNLIQEPYDGEADVIKQFQAKFPGIRVQSTVLHPSDAGPRIISEQKSGLYNWDVWWATASTMNNVVLPAGGFDRIGDYFVLKEVADPANWSVPPKYQYTQENAPYVFIHTHFLISFAHYNTQNVPGGNLTWANFLDPSLRGNIEVRPPTRNHGGTFMLAQIAKLRGIGYVEKLLTDMKPVYVDNDGQVTTAVMRGDTAIGIGTAADKLYECGKAGGCKTVRSIPAQVMHSRAIAVPKNPPHKAAAKVFVNWILSKEGQESYVKNWAVDNGEGATSLRKDVKPDPRHLASVPNLRNLGQYVAVSLESSKPELKAIQELYAKIRG